jgi:DDE superfamily endonuclease
LILDGHGSHATPEFDLFCTENKIITECMPSHTSHLLQPLDIACFCPLKTAYGQLVQNLARQAIFHVSKDDFLIMYQQARTTALTKSNIQSAFRATGLIPFNPECVLSQLAIETPLPPSPPPHGGQNSSPWKSETPRNLAQLAKQTDLVEQSILRLSQSPTQPLSKVLRSCQLAMSDNVLLQQENKELRATVAYLQEKKKRPRRYIQHGGIMVVGDVQQLILANNQAEQAESSQPRQRAPPTCSNCGTQGHTRNRCPLPLNTR